MTTRETTKRNPSEATLQKRAASRYIDAKAACAKAKLRADAAIAAAAVAVGEVTVAAEECARLGVPIAEEGKP